MSPTALESVRRAIADLNYVPNHAARSLASRQTHAIALVVPEDNTRFFGTSAHSIALSMRRYCGSPPS